MGYRYRSRWHEGIDIIVMTKKGIEYSGIPRGVIVPAHQKTVCDYFPKTRHNVYIVKHSEDFCTATHIVPGGIVNVFGWYITKEAVPGEDWTYIIGFGWFRRVTIDNMEQIERYL